MNKALWKYKILGFLMVALTAGGCKDILITATEDVCKNSVEVHLVGINWSEKEQWEKMSMTEYWQPDNPLWKSAKDYTYVIRYPKEPCEIRIKKNDSIQKVWNKRKAEYLFVLADLPGIHKDFPGSADARRLQLPAPDSKRWKGGQSQIKIEISGSGIACLSEIK